MTTLKTAARETVAQPTLGLDTSGYVQSRHLAGVHLKPVFPPLNLALMQESYALLL